jgi:hypothetical protein
LPPQNWGLFDPTFTVPVANNGEHLWIRVKSFNANGYALPSDVLEISQGSVPE